MDFITKKELSLLFDVDDIIYLTYLSLNEDIGYKYISLFEKKNLTEKDFYDFLSSGLGFKYRSKILESVGVDFNYKLYKSYEPYFLNKDKDFKRIIKLKVIGI